MSGSRLSTSTGWQYAIQVDSRPIHYSPWCSARWRQREFVRCFKTGFVRLGGVVAYSVSQKKSPLKFSDILSQTIEFFSPNFARLLCVPIYTGLQIFTQLPATLTKLCHIKRNHQSTIICSKCPPLTETLAGWSHLIWHNFVKVADNWIKICCLAWIGTRNRHIKFGRKIPNRLGKKSLKTSGGIFLTHTVVGLTGAPSTFSSHRISVLMSTTELDPTSVLRNSTCHFCSNSGVICKLVVGSGPSFPGPAFSNYFWSVVFRSYKFCYGELTP